jgi:hypothetical protein
MAKANPSRMRTKARVREAANPLDYKKVIVPRSFQKDWKPKDPRMVYPRLRQQVAFANR